MPDAPATTAFAQALAGAIAAPLTADLWQLLHEFERTVAELSDAMQLRVAGELLSQLADLELVRAEALLQAWDDRYPSSQLEPILTAELLQGVLRQSLTLDLELLMEQFEPQPRQGPAIDSVAAEVEPAVLLEWVEEREAAATMEAAMSLAHDEDVSAWGATIAQWMQSQQQQEVMLLDLRAALDWPIVKLWLALLLGEYVLEQRGEFYSGQIWVRSTGLNRP